jgi:hypothetical protein
MKRWRMSDRRIEVRFELGISDDVFEILMPHVIKDGMIIDPEASIIGPLGDAIVNFIKTVTPTFSFGPYGVIDLDEGGKDE